jgi:actin-related protein
MNLEHYRHRLESELQARRALAEKLIHTEEDTRKQLARELHDEIGQNITAIQIQSQLVKRASDTPLAIEAAGQINDLARRIHHSTRQLLRQLRPRAGRAVAPRPCTTWSTSSPLLNAGSAAVLTTGFPRRRERNAGLYPVSPAPGAAQQRLQTRQRQRSHDSALPASRAALPRGAR